ncbi:hypothetical protein COV19_06710 [Candidatus Woesearchaeota archaeon CG10_big_fil_rev_8_21_14_0_10_44_13]|nr:MAG: hypothetical protein COV19_06710 [Candidatus Woesearchaeota archaeon CG10_big_fil_rev_8_21_14_0_10_44_13]
MIELRYCAACEEGNFNNFISDSATLAEGFMARHKGHEITAMHGGRFEIATYQGARYYRAKEKDGNFLYLVETDTTSGRLVRCDEPSPGIFEEETEPSVGIGKALAIILRRYASQTENREE